MKKRKLLVSLIAGLMAALMLLGLIVSVIPTRASAASSSEIRDQISQLEEQEAELQAQIDALNGQLNENLSEMTDIVTQKKVLDQQVALLYTQIINANEQIRAYSVLIADKQEELDAAQARYDDLNERNKERIRTMEEDGSLSYWTVIFKASSFSDLLDRVNMVQEIAAADKRRLKELSDAAAVVAEAKAGLEEEKAGLESARESMVAAQAELEVKQAEATALLDALRARGDEFEALMEEAEVRQSEVMLEIAQKEEELEEAEYQEWLATYVPPPDYVGDTTPSSNAPSSSGWVCPVPYYTLSSPFGYRWHPIWGDYRFHYGIDMGLEAGNPIYAAKGGQVVSAGWNDSMGWYVKINHGDGFTSIYMHMTNHIVYYGDYVSAGQVIGFVGSTGDSTGPHLHFGIAYNGTYVNPLEYI